MFIYLIYNCTMLNSLKVKEKAADRQLCSETLVIDWKNYNFSEYSHCTWSAPNKINSLGLMLDSCFNHLSPLCILSAGHLLVLKKHKILSTNYPFNYRGPAEALFLLFSCPPEITDDHIRAQRL